MVTVAVCETLAVKSVLEISSNSSNSTRVCAWATWLNKFSKKSPSKSAPTWNELASSRRQLHKTWWHLNSEKTDDKYFR